MRNAIAAFLLVASLSAVAASRPYDETADAKAEIKSSLAEAEKTNVPVLLVFGANWCGDCQLLDTSFKSGESAPLIQKNFKVVKIDVGKFDKNVDVAESYGVPLKKGIPAVAILSPQGQVVYATKTGELANARKMGDRGIYDFFAKVTAPSK